MSTKNNPIPEPLPHPEDDEPATQQDVPFVPIGDGLAWKTKDGGYVSATAGTKGEVYLLWRNKSGRKTVARLSEDAAKLTAVALMHFAGHAEAIELNKNA